MVLWLVMRKRQISMFNHVSNLSLHRDTEQRDEVHDKNGPEHGDIENLEERADQGDRRRFGDCVPKLKFG